MGRNLDAILIKPLISEKTVKQQERNVYTFIVSQRANKYDVADAIKSQYDVTPEKVNVVNRAPRQYLSSTRRRRVKQPGMKKAYVYLKTGDSISLV